MSKVDSEKDCGSVNELLDTCNYSNIVRLNFTGIDDCVWGVELPELRVGLILQGGVIFPRGGVGNHVHTMG